MMRRRRCACVLALLASARGYVTSAPRRAPARRLVTASAAVDPTSFEGRLESALRRSFPDGAADRAIACVLHNARGETLESVVPASAGDDGGDDAADFLVQRAHTFVDGLSVTCFHDAQAHAWVRELEANWRVVADELSRELARAGGGEGGEGEGGGEPLFLGARDAGAGEAYGAGWKTLGLYDRENWDAANAARSPRTCALLRASRAPVVEAFFAKMPAGATIKPHTDECNFVLTCHVGVAVPPGGACTLRVGDATRAWADGEALLFDTSVVHAAQNRATADRSARVPPRRARGRRGRNAEAHLLPRRYVLMLRVWHPELTPAERDALQFVFDAIDEPDLVSGDGADDARLAVLRGYRARAADALFGAGGSAVPGGAPRVAAAHAKAKAADGGKAKRRKKGKKAKGFGG